MKKSRALTLSALYLAAYVNGAIADDSPQRPAKEAFESSLPRLPAHESRPSPTPCAALAGESADLAGSHEN